MRRHGLTIVSVAVVIVLFALRTGLADQPLTRFEFHRKAMGVDFTIVLYGSQMGAANIAAKAALDRVTQLDGICSDYQATSELRRVCAQARPGQPMPVSEDLVRVLELSQRISKSSRGAFDVTVGPLTKLWRRARRQKALPPADRLKQARSLVGYRLVSVDRPARRVTLKRGGMRLDLGGIAKGYAVDRAMEILARRGFTRAMVDGSGDLAVGDPPPGRPGWRVAVASLENPDKRPVEVLELANVAVATSGDAYQSVTISGTRYSHILDPRTGLGLTTSSSVTVIAADAATADAMASAVSVLGPVAGQRLVAETRGVESLFVTRVENSSRIHKSKGWPGCSATR
ncbi:MAG: FAD:protein FMN transferase [Planctomycetota bacterium]|nr:FAD:protein FMN transferase [Planctomycetota bacterium]